MGPDQIVTTTPARRTWGQIRTSQPLCRAASLRPRSGGRFGLSGHSFCSASGPPVSRVGRDCGWRAVGQAIRSSRRPRRPGRSRTGRTPSRIQDRSYGGAHELLGRVDHRVKQHGQHGTDHGRDHCGGPGVVVADAAHVPTKRRSEAGPAAVASRYWIGDPWWCQTCDKRGPLGFGEAHNSRGRISK